MKKRRGQRPKKSRKNSIIMNINFDFTNSHVYSSEELKKIVLKTVKETTEKNI